jgi:hypothetical protein
LAFFGLKIHHLATLASSARRAQTFPPKSTADGRNDQSFRGGCQEQTPFFLSGRPEYQKRVNYSWRRKRSCGTRKEHFWLKKICGEKSESMYAEGINNFIRRSDATA